MTRLTRPILLMTVLLLGACAQTSALDVRRSAASANVLAHQQATGNLPASAERLTLAIKRYNEHDSIAPVNMQTTDNVSGE